MPVLTFAHRCDRRPQSQAQGPSSPSRTELLQSATGGVRSQGHSIQERSTSLDHEGVFGWLGEVALHRSGWIFRGVFVVLADHLLSQLRFSTEICGDLIGRVHMLGDKRGIKPLCWIPRRSVDSNVVRPCRILGAGSFHETGP